MIVVGLCGRAGAGKSTFATALSTALERKGKEVAIIPFAKAVKDIATYLGWNGLKDEKGRKLLQLLGTEVCRECIDQDYWIKKWLASVDKFRKDIYFKAYADMAIIADDVRFNNEVSTIKKLGGKIIRLNGREDPRVTTEHASERGIDDNVCDGFINNDGSLNLLHWNAEMLVEGLIK